MESRFKIQEKDLPSNKKFGLFFSFIFFCISLFFFLKNAIFLAIFFASLFSLFLLITLFIARTLLPLNKLWMKLGLFLGMIVSPIILGIVFFVLFTPISFLMKLFKRDELVLKQNNKTSYWKTRSPKGPDPESLKNQF